MEINGSEYKIEKGIPLPAKRSKAGTLGAAVKQMEVGDSILVEDKTPGYLSGYLAHFRHRYGIKITCRTVEGGVRVWRIA